MIEQTDNSNDNNNKNPQSTNTKAMDSKKDVENSIDEKTDQDFPGYPHYPAREDIMTPDNDLTREKVDLDNPSDINESGVSQTFSSAQNLENKDSANPEPNTQEDNEAK